MNKILLFRHIVPVWNWNLCRSVHKASGCILFLISSPASSGVGANFASMAETLARRGLVLWNASIKIPHTALLAKQISFPFVSPYQYKFNLFYSAKWLFAQLTLNYYSHTCLLSPHTHTRTHTFCHFILNFTHSDALAVGLQGC